MANYLSLEEAAQKLSIPTDRLVELRSQGEIRGFRDGTSWKFPENEIDRLADDLAAGVIEAGTLGGGGESNIIGGDAGVADDAGGSDLEIGGEPMVDSDVNVIASEAEGSDVAIVASDSDLVADSGEADLLEIDSAELQLEDSAVLHDSGQLDLAIEPNAGSTGPVTEKELKAISDSHRDVLAPEPEPAAAAESGGSSSGSIDLDAEAGDIKLEGESDLSFSGPGPDHDSGDVLLGADDDSAMDDIELSGSGSGAAISPGGGASSLEMLGGELGEADAGAPVEQGSRGDDVLSELDLMSAEQQGSGLIAGDSENILKSSGLGSSIGADGFQDSDLAGLDDALADDDELVIADDDDDLVISSAGSDISVAGDSGINLMSPSDSGLSLESEPLDLAGSSISALDLGAELAEGGSSGSGVGSGSGSDGSMVDFQADEEFQLSPSGVGVDADIESGSQVIEVEDSEAVGEPVEFGDAGFDAESAGDALALDAEEGVDVDATAGATVRPAMAYEIPFTTLQCVTLMLILCVLGLSGMLMTDLVRNMWTYSEPTAPVSSLTNSLIDLMGW